MSNAGFKQTLKELEPVSLFSFDGEKLTDNPRFLANHEIFDEIGNATAHIALEHTGEEMPCYHMATGLTPIDAYDQKSIRFCPHGLQPNAPENGLTFMPKAYIIAPGVKEWDFSNREFTYIVQGRTDYSYLNWEDTDRDEHGRQRQKRWSHSSYCNVLFKHEGIITVYEIINRYSSNYLVFELHGLKTISLEHTRPFSDRETDYPDLLTIRFKNGEFTVLKNMNVIHQEKIKFDEARVDFNVTRRMLTIGGTDLPVLQHRNFADRCVIPTTMDNFTIFNYALPDAEIVRLYRKMFNFSDMIQKSRSNFFYPFDDKHKANYTIRNLGTDTINIHLTGDVKNIRSEERGPFQLGFSTLFTSNTYEGLNTYNERGWWFNPIEDFTLFLHFKIVNTEKGTIISQGTRTHSYYGFTLDANSFNGEHKPGALELVVPGHNSIILSEEMPLDVWNEVIIRKKNESLTVVYNKNVVAENRVMKVDVTQNQLKSMGDAKLLTSHYQERPTQAYLANLVIWRHAVSDYFLKAIIDYENVSYVRGVVMMQGNPMRAKVRAYNHITGAFINEVWSDGETGAYVIHLHDNTPIDLVVIDDKDIMSRLRAYGPITPYSRPYDTTYLSY